VETRTYDEAKDAPEQKLLGYLVVTEKHGTLNSDRGVIFFLQLDCWII
jgi:hypothetical protein